MIQALITLHEIQVDVGNDAGDVESLVEQAPVLGRGADRDAQSAAFAQRRNDWRKLDGFRPRADDDDVMIGHIQAPPSVAIQKFA